MDKWVRENSGTFSRAKSRKVKRSYVIDGRVVVAKDINSAKCKAVALGKAEA